MTICDEVLTNLEMRAKALNCLAALVHLHGDKNSTSYLALLKADFDSRMVQ